MEYEEICLVCGKQLIEGKNIKQNWHKPLCNNCRENVLNYFMNKEKIDRIMKARILKGI